jgi:hypothetical protein
LLITPTAAFPPEVREVASLRPEERLRLPDATRVTIRGHIITLRQLRAFHAIRLRMSANAARLGREKLEFIRAQHFGLTQKNEVVIAPSGHPMPAPAQTMQTMSLREGVPSGLKFGVGGVGGGGQGPQHYPIFRGGNSGGNPIVWLLNPIPIPQAILKSYAKDYQDFCNAARATTCIYLPIVPSWAGPTSISNTQLGSPTQSIVDPLVTDSTVCAEGGGSIGPDGCSYTYPMVETTDFAPNASPAFVANCATDPWVTQNQLGPEWKTIVDPHGAASASFAVNYTWPPWLVQVDTSDYKGGNPATCVVQVFAPNG